MVIRLHSIKGTVEVTTKDSHSHDGAWKAEIRKALKTRKYLPGHASSDLSLPTKSHL